MLPFKGKLLSLAAITVLVVGGTALWRNYLAVSCTGNLLYRAASPDGAKEALIREYHCENSFLTDITAEVSITFREHQGPPQGPPQEPLRETIILGSDTGGDHDFRPRIAWASDSTLRVVLRPEAFLKVLTRHAAGVDIDIAFEPGGYAARIAALKRQGLEPDPLEGPSPVSETSH